MFPHGRMGNLRKSILFPKLPSNAQTPRTLLNNSKVIKVPYLLPGGQAHCVLQQRNTHTRTWMYATCKRVIYRMLYEKKYIHVSLSQNKLRPLYNYRGTAAFAQSGYCFIIFKRCFSFGSLCCRKAKTYFCVILPRERIRILSSTKKKKSENYKAVYAV